LKDKVMGFQNAMRRAFKDTELHRECEKLTGVDRDPLVPEGMEKAIREMPRDAEVIEVLQGFRGGPASRAITVKAGYYQQKI
jgi:hypothetical protein